MSQIAELAKEIREFAMRIDHAKNTMPAEFKSKLSGMVHDLYELADTMHPEGIPSIED